MQDIMIIKLHVFTHIQQKLTYFWTSVWFLFVIEFQNHGSEHDHGLLWIKDAPIYVINTNEKIEIFIYKCISCDILLLLITLQNAEQHQHIQTCKKKIVLYVDSIVPYLPWIKQQY